MTTKRVRIMVVIDPYEKWQSVGSFSWTDEETRRQTDEIIGDLGPPPWGYHWVEADVPVPVELDDVPIKGTVV